MRGDDIVVATREVSRFLDKFAEHDIPELQSFVARYKDGLDVHVPRNLTLFKAPPVPKPD